MDPSSHLSSSRQRAVGAAAPRGTTSGGTPPSSTPLPVEVLALVATFASISCNLLDKLCELHQQEKDREALERCYYHRNWSFLEQLLAMGPDHFCKQFSNWFCHNGEYFEDIKTDSSVSMCTRSVLTNPSLSARVDCVLLLEHLLDKIGVDVNDLHPYLTSRGNPEFDFYGSAVSKHLLAIAAEHNSSECFKYILSREDTDVHRLASENEDMGDLFVAQLVLDEAVQFPQTKIPFFRSLLRHLSFDPNRAFVDPQRETSQTILDFAVRRGVLIANVHITPYLQVTEMLIVAGADVHNRAEVGVPSPYERARFWAAHDDREASANAREFVDIMRKIPAAIRISSMIRGHLTRRHRRRLHTIAVVDVAD